MTKKQFYGSTGWKWFRRYMLLKYAQHSNGTWYVKCATSKRFLPLPDKKTHLGHLIPVFQGNSTNLATAFDERNVLPQCYQHNRMEGGRPLEMMEAINKVHGEGTVAELTRISKQFCKLDRVDLKEIGDTYREKFNELAKVKGDPWK